MVSDFFQLLTIIVSGLCVTHATCHAHRLLTGHSLLSSLPRHAAEYAARVAMARTAVISFRFHKPPLCVVLHMSRPLVMMSLSSLSLPAFCCRTATSASISSVCSVDYRPFLSLLPLACAANHSGHLVFTSRLPFDSWVSTMHPTVTRPTHW